MPVVVMHNKSEPRYDGDVMDEVLSFLEEAAERAVRAGIPAEHVILDPGFGFGKTADHNLQVLARLDEIAARLFISPATAKTHVSRAMSKLEARDRAQLVVIAYETGLVTPGG